MARYTKPLPGKVDLKLLWQKIILDQVTRIMMALSEGDASTRFERYYMAVMGLDSILMWYQDDTFRKEIQASEPKFKEMLDEIENIKKEVTTEDQKNIDFLRSKMRLDKLMKLIGRAGFYPEQEAGATEEGGVYGSDNESEPT